VEHFQSHGNFSSHQHFRLARDGVRGARRCARLCVGTPQHLAHDTATGAQAGGARRRCRGDRLCVACGVAGPLRSARC
jgi:hypothetical protein